MPYKLNQPRRHKFPTAKYRVTNWPDYDAALVRRGALTVWFTDEAIAAWRAPATGKRGGQPIYSTLAIETALTIRLVSLWCMNRREAEPIVLGVPHDSDVQRWRANKVLQRRHDRRVDGALPVGLDDPCRTNSTRAAATRYRWPGIA